MDSKNEQFIKSKIASYLGIDERHIFGINVDGRLTMAIANDVANLPDNPNYLDWSDIDELQPLTINKFDTKVFDLGCDLEFIKCVFGCKLLGRFKKINNKVRFESCIFKEKVNFSDSAFKKETRFVGSTFENKADFSYSVFSDQAYFSYATFKNEARFSYSTFQKETNFFKSTFENKADFFKSTFQNEANFFKSTFENQADFFKSTFENQADFFSSAFANKANFSRSIFHNVVSFNSVLFKDMINFLEARFEKGIDLVNSQLELSFDAVRSKIESGNENAKSERANEYRDTFRLLKQSLIKDGNLLDASSYHRAELYCKEIELKHFTKEKLHEERKELEIQKREISQEKKLALLRVSTKLAIVRAKIRLPIITTTTELKNSIDHIQLAFYRIVSDHHTDLLRIINSLVVLIGFIAFPLSLSVGHCVDFIQGIVGEALLKLVVTYNDLFIVGSAIACLASMLFQSIRYISVPFGYVFTALILCCSPKFILSFTSLFGDNTHTIPQNIIIAFYTILFAILLFSLQKTARKNSIVPS